MKDRSKKKHRTKVTDEQWVAALLFMSFLYGEYLHWSLLQPLTVDISPRDWMEAILGEWPG